MQAGLGYEGALDAPLGELLDYMAIYQIKQEGFLPAEPVEPDKDAHDDFFALLTRR